jgi:hypothetical protein
MASIARDDAWSVWFTAAKMGLSILLSPAFVGGWLLVVEGGREKEKESESERRRGAGKGG